MKFGNFFDLLLEREGFDNFFDVKNYLFYLMASIIASSFGSM